MNNATCPKCGKSHYSTGPSFTTSLYYPPIYKDGININPNQNKSTITMHCMECGNNWVDTF